MYDEAMTTTTAHTEITGAEIRRGHIVRIRDTFSRIHRDPALYTVFVLDTNPASSGTRHIDGVGVMVTLDDGCHYELFCDLILVVADDEPVVLVGTMNPDDWSADYARRAAMA